ncbi:hydroxyethylthiazole kinase [Bacillus sp. CECT 9360]|uniref:hydroxyethylthiazole kinase n=1 Tax=Bacillus sp. CECT 9360 TaxID=2845821 RepID=UPI001E5484D3|nr:hydroxyethylthiazole kinase [Bacillus sp. CECT 9360]CAH0345795.1 Hydroxyethylthiazole kinase [Bacillus sp. CECT 9360]
MKEIITPLFAKVRRQNPLVHQITNHVTMNDCANVTLAIGGSPVMASSPEEAEDMVRLANALVINFGTIDNETFEAMLLAGKAANKNKTPVIFDPVGVGATQYRTKLANQFIKEVKLSIVRGNASEIYSLIGGNVHTRGVDSGNVAMANSGLAGSAAKKLQCVCVVSGEQDAVSDGERTVLVDNGDSLLTKITGSGCMSTAIIGSIAGVTEDFFSAAVAGISTMSISGEMTATRLNDNEGTGTFRIKLIDCISLMTGETWEKEVKLSEPLPAH